ncbi:iron complex transport system substrate-binding protein [Rhodococcus sp. 27YEA15]|uniref:ABC transporter substrate-binding protein n=1 Tax=Rhodococcus sp. 27YEA15 TaxID=3156259 RepID=UPI003C7A9867
MSPKFTPVRAAVSLFAVALVAAGCSKGDAAQDSASTESFAQPVTITNCDREETFDAPPQRIVTMNNHVTEVLIEMGVGDRIVGMGYGNATPTPETAEQFAKITNLAKEYPTAEQILDLDPDLIVGGMSSAFQEKEGRSRELFAERGINTFLFSEYCGKGFPDISMLENDYSQLGRVLGVEEGAAAVTEQVVGGLDAVKAAVADTPVVPTFFYDGGKDVPTTIGGVGVGQLVGDYAGASNIYSEGERPYVKTTWEVVGERAPQAVVVLDYGDESAEQKIDFLKSHPVMATTPAVQQNRFVVVPLSDFFESPRLVRSAQTIAAALHPGVVTTP